MRIVCQQMIVMKYHALSVIFEKKSSKIWNCRLLLIVGGALRVNDGTIMFLYEQCHVISNNVVFWQV